MVHFADLGEALIKARDEGMDPYIVLEMIMIWEKLVQSVEEAKQLARPIDYDYLDLLEKKFYTLRKYTPTLLKSFEFHSTKSTEPLIRAIHTIREMNETSLYGFLYRSSKTNPVYVGFYIEAVKRIQFTTKLYATTNKEC